MIVCVPTKLFSPVLASSEVLEPPPQAASTSTIQDKRNNRIFNYYNVISSKNEEIEYTLINVFFHMKLMLLALRKLNILARI